MAVEDLTQSDTSNKTETKPQQQQMDDGRKITSEAKQLMNGTKPIISSKRLNHSGHNCEESSFRTYYGANNRDISVPFNWESHPGTPKHTHKHGNGNYTPSRTNTSKTNKNSSAIRAPLTPPPSYQVKKLQAAASCKNPTDIINGSSPKLSTSKININHFLSTALPRRFVLLKNFSSSTNGGNNSPPTTTVPADTSHSRSSSSSSPRTSLSSLWASDSSSSTSHSPRTTLVPSTRKSPTSAEGATDTDQTNKQQVDNNNNKKQPFTTVDSDEDEEPQCSTTCFGTPSYAAAYASPGHGGGYRGTRIGHSPVTGSAVRNAILSVVSCRVMRSSHHHVDYVV